MKRITCHQSQKSRDISERGTICWSRIVTFSTKQIQKRVSTLTDGRRRSFAFMFRKKPVVSRKLVFISRRSGKIWNKLLPEQFLVYLTLTDWSWPFPDFQMLPSSITAFLKGKLNVTFQRSSRVLYILKQTYLVHI